MPGNYFAALPVRVPDDFLPSLKKDAPEALRWFHADDLHLTLAFFGRENPDRKRPILEVIQHICLDPLPSTLSSLRCLPHPRRFKALSFELAEGETRDAVTALIAEWRPRLCEAAGVEPDPRPPYPHLTVARPDRQHPHFRPKLIAKWARSLEPPAAKIEILPPALYTWHPDRPVRQFQFQRPDSNH